MATSRALWDSLFWVLAGFVRCSFPFGGGFEWPSLVLRRALKGIQGVLSHDASQHQFRRREKARGEVGFRFGGAHYSPRMADTLAGIEDSSVRLSGLAPLASCCVSGAD